MLILPCVHYESGIYKQTHAPTHTNIILIYYIFGNDMIRMCVQYEASQMICFHARCVLTHSQNKESIVYCFDQDYYNIEIEPPL